MAPKWQPTNVLAFLNFCETGCDKLHGTLQKNAHAFPHAHHALPSARLQCYITPSKDQLLFPGGKERAWPMELLRLTQAEASSLSIIDLHVDFKTVQGGKAPVKNKKKLAVTRGIWRRLKIEGELPTQHARDAYNWLLQNNTTYRSFIQQHNYLIDNNQNIQGWQTILTVDLLLKMQGIEVAARPWLYPRASFDATDIKDRLQLIGALDKRRLPSLKASFMRKMLSRCVSYEEVFPLFCFLYDVSLARKISAIVSIADTKKIAPEQIASNQQQFDSFWRQEQTKLEDMCRQMGKMPNFVFTVAPAEWKFRYHRGMQQWRIDEKSLSDGQAIMTLQLHHCIKSIVESIALKKGNREEDDPLRMAGIEEVLEWSCRWEFQGRGTLHVHVVAWVNFTSSAGGFEGSKALGGMSNDTDPNNSPALSLLEDQFNASVDVQCGDGSHCLLRYVTGYVSKASDALAFKSKESHGQSHWRQVYRLLCKRAPLLPEMTMKFATLALMRSSFRGATIFAPIPGSAANNASRWLYQLFLASAAAKIQGADKGCFIDYAKEYDVVQTWPYGKEGRMVPVAKKRSGARGVGANKDKCVLGISFPFELLDIFIGAWCTMMVPHSEEKELIPDDDNAPEGVRFLAAALKTQRYGGDVNKFIEDILPDLILRGLGNHDKQHSNTECSQVISSLLRAKNFQTILDTW